MTISPILIRVSGNIASADGGSSVSNIALFFD